MTVEELRKIIARGETLCVEFKSDRDKLSDRALVEAVAAMANTDGGILLQGVEDKTGEIDEWIADGLIGRVDGHADEYILDKAIRAKITAEPIGHASGTIAHREMVIEFIEKHGRCKRRDVMALCSVNRSKAYKILLKMCESGQILKQGEKKKTYYILPGFVGGVHKGA